MEKLWVILSVLCGNYGFEITETEYLGDGIMNMGLSGSIGGTDGKGWDINISLDYQTNGSVNYGYYEIKGEDEWHEWTTLKEGLIDGYDSRHMADFMDNLIKEFENR